MINVLIADDHKLLIDGIKSSLEDATDINIAAEAYHGLQVLKILQSGEKIDVILMDINMPQMDGLDCTKIVSKKYPKVKVIALSQYSEKRFVKRMVKYGAMGYLLKDTDKYELIKAIKKVYSGEKYFNERLSMTILNRELNEENKRHLFPDLTSREKEILTMICQEYSSQDIADRLFISNKTVHNHRANLIIKAGVKNTAGLVRWALENDYFN